MRHISRDVHCLEKSATHTGNFNWPTKSCQMTCPKLVCNRVGQLLLVRGLTGATSMFVTHPVLNTVNIGFRNQPPSEGSRLLNPARPLKQEVYSDQVVAKARVWQLNVFLFLCPLGLATTTVVIYYIKVKFRGRYIQGRYLCTDGGPSRRLRSLNPARPHYPRLQNPTVTVFTLRIHHCWKKT